MDQIRAAQLKKVPQLSLLSHVSIILLGTNCLDVITCIMNNTISPTSVMITRKRLPIHIEIKLLLEKCI